MPRRRRITVIGRDGEKTRVEENSHLKELYFERKFGSSFKEPSIINYSNESNGWYHDAKVERGESTNSEGSYTNSQRSKSEGSFNNTISNRENSNIVSPTPSNSPNKPKTKNKGKGSRKSKKNKSRRKGNRKSKKNKSRKEANKKRNAEIRSQRNAKATRNKKFNSPN